MEIRPMSCCGVRELNGLSWETEPEMSFISFANQIYDLAPNAPHNCKFRYAIFTEALLADQKDRAKNFSYGLNFEAYILENKLGTVTKTGENLNPNSGRDVIVYVWTIDHDQCRKHISELSKGVRKKRLVSVKTKIANMQVSEGGQSLWATGAPPTSIASANTASAISSAQP